MRKIGCIVPFLIILDPSQCGRDIQIRFRQHAEQKEPNLIDSQRRSSILKSQPETDQEVMRQGDQQHMVMPTQPATHFVLIQAHGCMSV